MRQLPRLALTSALTALVLAAIAGTASATSVPGPNGKIAFASGRASVGHPTPDPADADARIWVADGLSSGAVQVTTLPDGMQHRHPNWSPDHTKIAYAAGTAFSGTYAIWIADLTTGQQFQFVPAAAGQDRPTWSPDGTKIAYGDGAGIAVKDIAPGSMPVQITSNSTDQRAVWSPDGNTIYFNRGAAGDRDIWSKTPVSPTGTETDLLNGTGMANDDWQPAVSPDGSKLCFLRGQQDATSGNLETANVNGTGVTGFATEPGITELNCVWSPDGSSILYTRGAFGAGDLAIRDKNGGNMQTLTGLSVASHFDGNADWATNFPPTCQNQTVNTGVNQFVSIQLVCIDPDFGNGAAAPTPTPIDAVFMDLNTQGLKGNIGNLSPDAKVVYTPPKDFKGTDSFAFDGTDGTSFANGTITIHVGTNPNGTIDNTAPKFSSVRISAKRWRRGAALPHISKTKVGMTISFRLSEAGRVTLGFQKKTKGRRVGGKCRKQTSHNRSKRRCTRFVSAGSVPGFAGKAGLNKVRFQGRLTTRRRLGLGTYRLVLSVVDNAANRSKRNGPTFTIVAH
jgi:dipeptidyl aminopeptidase/acylaminoacyl peptidase